MEEPQELLDLLALAPVAEALLRHTDAVALAQLHGCCREARTTLTAACGPRCWREALEAALRHKRADGTSADMMRGEDSEDSDSDSSSGSDTAVLAAEAVNVAAAEPLAAEPEEQGVEVAEAIEMLVGSDDATAPTRWELLQACRGLVAAGACDSVDWSAAFRQHGAAVHMRRLRKVRLVAALESRNLKLRRDSWLCRHYLAGTGTVGCEEIVDKMEEMDYFYTNRTTRNECDNIGVHQWSKRIGVHYDNTLRLLRETEIPTELAAMRTDAAAMDGEDSPLAGPLASPAFSRPAAGFGDIPVEYDGDLMRLSFPNHELSALAKHRCICLTAAASSVIVLRLDGEDDSAVERAAANGERQPIFATADRPDGHTVGFTDNCKDHASVVYQTWRSYCSFWSTCERDGIASTSVPLPLGAGQPERILSGAPASMHDRIRMWLAAAPRRPYADLSDEEKAARRAELASRIATARQEVDEAIATHLATLQQYAAHPGPADVHDDSTWLRLPAGLSTDLRARLHDAAEQLGLEHWSEGEGSERRLVVSRAIPDEAAEEMVAAAISSSSEEEDDDTDDGVGDVLYADMQG